MSDCTDLYAPVRIAWSVADRLHALTYASTHAKYQKLLAELLDNKGAVWRKELAALRTPFGHAPKNAGYPVADALAAFDELAAAAHDAAITGHKLPTRRTDCEVREVVAEGDTWKPADGMPWVDPTEPARKQVEEAVGRIGGAVLKLNGIAAYAGAKKREPGAKGLKKIRGKRE